MKIGDAKGGTDLLLYELCQATPTDTSDHFADQPTIANGMVGGNFARMVNGSHGGKAITHAIPVAHFADSDLRHVTHTRGMRQQLTNGNKVLAILDEFGPIATHQVVVLQQSTFGQDMDAQ
mmetsp:Transcript_15779/g.22544  ORF Transcript_15779/g.22544 Transcript_15779/m.22544 type:complete len:121 (+) Transcript_15779:1026-1388(+)